MPLGESKKTRKDISFLPMLTTLMQWKKKTDAVKKNTEALLDASKEADVEVNSEKIKYMLRSNYLKAGEKHNIKTVNRSFEDEEKFKYLGTTLTDQNCMHKEIKSRLNSGNACTNWFRAFCLPTCCLGT
jgi:5,10-methylene-tetrahydrofolate dehydrogenase/methenyl tetrahydrofolate cyclohydrolase